ncbi:TetR/AcrR family transcriptional regulator [Seongchinamella unica]|uniref:TetR/AcrR family transcriptional regulator n=1 Tax=Seongchinamella unica TaxID=2547392 RepID=A0A4R5LPM7_9GAMM|nr:TetR/AcrR family transcriptional regulator [Seongchinamella unica]TDG12421.1 TetR/AcrR family transcriptional regulator [Seongchinamella unica]
MAKVAQRGASPRKSKEDRVSAILAAATEVFEEVGYQDAKISDIARRIGVVEGTVFHYFSTKQRLMVRIIEDFYRQVTTDVRAGLVGIAGTRNRLAYIIRFHLEVVTRNSRLCGEILRESRGLDGELAHAVSQLNQGYTRCLSEVIKEGIETGEIAPDTSIPLVRNTVYGSIEHTLWAVINDRLEVDVEAEARSLTGLVYQGIASSDQPDQRDIASLIRQLNRLLAGG